MQYRKFGNTDLHVSETGFGAWAVGGAATIGETVIGWGDADDNESKKAIHAALDEGINFFDTADIYGLGHSEEILGQTIGKMKDILIATKGGNVARDNKFTTDYSKAHIMNACEQSLRRLKRDTIDYYQLHTVRLPQLNEGTCIEAVETLQQQGKIRYWGISLNTFDPLPEAEWLLENKKGNGFQLVLNIINQRALPLLKKSAEEGYGLIARMPLQFGLLTGKFQENTTFAENDHRKKRLTEQVISETEKILAPVWQLCRKYSCSRTALAMSYIMSHREISVTIPGIRNTVQARQNAAETILLEKADIEKIEEWGETSIAVLLDLIQQQG
jgi:aryl-alcohol dehydrogenase-like predicted oxidoreductase